MKPSRATLALLPLALSGCDLNPCDNTVHSALAAPGGGVQAVLFSRECGATTGFSSQLSIMRVGESPSEDGNATIVDGKNALKVRWLASRKLEVTHTEPGRVFKQEQLVNGVEIVYAK